MQKNGSVKKGTSDSSSGEDTRQQTTSQKMKVRLEDTVTFQTQSKQNLEGVAAVWTAAVVKP